MSKRRDALKDYLVPVTNNQFSTENAAIRHRPQVTSGALQSMNDAISGLSKEADELRNAVANGSIIVELDASQIDDSFVKDRLGDYAGEEFENLVTSLAENGQAIPVLVRPHPNKGGHYQLAFGHRRVAALRTLNMRVKAFVREMSDDELVIAQGNENLERKDLSFIERAMFARRLEDRGMSRRVIMSAFGSKSKGVLSEMINLARRLPEDLVQAIGPAPRTGRPRWLALAELVATDLNIWRDIIRQPQFHKLASDERFEVVYQSTQPQLRKGGEEAFTWTPKDRTVNVRKSRTDRGVTMSFTAKDGKDFGEWITNNLESLYEAFRTEGIENGD